MTSYLCAAGAVSTTTEDGAQFSTDGLLRDNCWPELHAAYKKMWRVQFKYFAEVLKITEVRVSSLVLHTVLCITSHHKVGAIHAVTVWSGCNRIHPHSNPTVAIWTHAQPVHPGCRL